MDKFELQQVAARLNAKIANARELLHQAAEEASQFAKSVSAIPDDPQTSSLEDQQISIFSQAPQELFSPKIIDSHEEAAIGRRQAIERAGQDKARLADAAAGEVLKAIENQSPQLAAAVRQRQAAQAEDTGVPRLASAPKTDLSGGSHDEVIREGWLQRFYGGTSIIYKYFGEKSLPNGRGMINPGNNNLYDADLTNIALSTLTKWPEGFYRNKATSGLQYLLKSPTVLLVIDFHEYATGGDEGLVIHFSPRVNDVIRTTPRKLSLKDIQAVLPIFEKELLRLSLLAQQGV